MSFLYLNTGYSALFKSSSFSFLENSTYNNLNNVVVYDGYGLISLSYIPSFIYGKFDFYITSLSSLNVSVCVGGDNLVNGFIFILNNNNVYCYDKYNTSNVVNIGGITYDSNCLKENDLNKLLFYISPSELGNDGDIVIKVNDISVFELHNIEFYFRQPTIEISSEHSDVFLSNFVLSDTEINSDCEIVCPQISVISDVESNDGVYHFVTRDQKLIQELNLETLISSYGKNADVLGFVNAGMNTYSVLSNVGKFHSVEKSNVDYVTRKQFELTENNSDCIIDSQILYNTKLINMNNKQYGWIAKV